MKDHLIAYGPNETRKDIIYWRINPATYTEFFLAELRKSLHAFISSSSITIYVCQGTLAKMSLRQWVAVKNFTYTLSIELTLHLVFLFRFIENILKIKKQL